MILVLPTGRRAFILPGDRAGQERVLRRVCEAIWGDTRERVQGRKAAPSATDEHTAFRSSVFLPSYYTDAKRRLGTWR